MVIASAKQLHTTSNMYICSMAIGDLLFLLVCTPLNIYQLYALDCWKLGALACAASFYLMNVSAPLPLNELHPQCRPHTPRPERQFGTIWQIEFRMEGNAGKGRWQNRKPCLSRGSVWNEPINSAISCQDVIWLLARARVQTELQHSSVSNWRLFPYFNLSINLCSSFSKHPKFLQLPLKTQPWSKCIITISALKSVSFLEVCCWK